MLGEGGFGQVFKRGNKAVKKFPGKNRLPHLIQEYTVLRYLSDCQYVVREKGINIDKMELNMELYDGSLRKWMNENSNRSGSDMKMIIIAILKGLIELHDRGVAHGDLKPGNILLTTTGSGEGEGKFKIVLGDLGLASVSKYAKMTKTAAQYRDHVVHFDTSHDMYSFGITITELLTGKKVNKHLNYEKLNTFVKNAVHDRDICNLILKLVQADHSLRPTARETLAFFTNETMPIVYNNNAVIDYQLDKIDSEIQTLLSDIYKVYGINRTKQGFYGLLNFFANQPDEKKKYEVYVAALLIILDANFGRKKDFTRITYDDISNIFDNRYNKDKIHTAVLNLLNDRPFLNNIFM